MKHPLTSIDKHIIAYLERNKDLLPEEIHSPRGILNKDLLLELMNNALETGDISEPTRYMLVTFNNYIIGQLNEI